MVNTQKYYDEQARLFFENTVNVDMTKLYQTFIRYLPKDACILDIGCGSGRDTLYFLKQGFKVEAFDYSENLVALATKHTGIPVAFKSFYDLADDGRFDGIWACASLLHCDRDRLPEVFSKIITALKPHGIFYASFKLGDLDRIKEGRAFTDLSQAQAKILLNHFDNILLLEQWISSDNRSDRNDEWLNIIIQKEGS